MGAVARKLATLREVQANGGLIPNSFTNPRVVSLSSMGIPDDATITGTGPSDFGNSYYGTLNLPAMGSRPAETVTQRIQSVLDLAATGPLTIIWDVRCSVGVAAVPGNSGFQFLTALTLRRPGNLHVLAIPGCGAILRPQTNATMFGNETPTLGTIISGAGTNTTTAVIGGIAFGNVVFEGITLNANSGVSATGFGSSANQPHPTLGSTLTLNVFRLWGVQDVTFRGCTILGSAGYQAHFANWQRLLFDGCTIDSLGTGFNGTLTGGNDCIHLNGPGDQCTIRDCLLATEDDYIAINTADGNTGDGSFGGPGNFPYWGALTRVRGYNLRSTRSDTAGGNFVRILTCGSIVNSGHAFDGLYGTIMGVAAIDNSLAPGATAGGAGPIEFRNIDLDFSRAILVGNGSTMTGVARVSVVGVTRSGSHLAVPLMQVSTSATQIDIDGLNVIDDGTSGSDKTQIHVLSGGSVGDLAAKKVRLGGSAANTTMPLLKIETGGAVLSLLTSDVRSNNVAAHVVVNGGSLIDSVCGGHRMTNAGSGAIVSNAGTWDNSMLSNTPASTLDFTGTAPTTKKGDYYS